MYKYYYQDWEKIPELLHIQTVLSDSLEKIQKAPDVESTAVINTIKYTNSRLTEKMNHGSIYGLPASWFFWWQQKRLKRQGLNQIDRYALLKSAAKSLLNMVPVNFQDFTISKERLDLLQPVENLDCQNECDFFLDQPSYVKSDLEHETVSGNKKLGSDKPMFKGIIQDFIDYMDPQQQQGVIDTLKDNFWWRDHHQIINALFFSNSLMRCFTQDKVRVQSAKLLIDHLMNNPITMSERDIIMSTLPHIVNCNYEPFSFQKLSKFFSRPNMIQNGPTNTHTVSFCQNIRSREEILFNDKAEEITWFDQRNFAINTPEFKTIMGTWQLMMDNEETDKDLLTIPVEHYLIDFHALYLFKKLTYIRTGKDIKKYEPLTIQDIIQQINSKYGYDIEKHIALQRIIDSQFVSAQSYFTNLFYLYIIGFAGCFIAQMMVHNNSLAVQILINICLAVAVIFQFLSLIEFKNLPNKWDFFDFFNIANNTTFILFYVYYAHRHKNLAINYLPREVTAIDKEDKEFEYNFQAFTSVLTTLILIGIIIKAMDLVRYNKNMGKLVKLVFAVLWDVRHLFAFLLLNICMFALFYLTLGLELSSAKKVQDLVYWDYFILSWKIATKGSNSQAGTETIWNGTDYQILQEIVMLLTIFNEIYLKIIMLSFLIAIVKKTFDTQMKIEKENTYQMRTDMNKESSTVINQIGLLDQQDCFVLSAQFQSPSQPDKIDTLKGQMTKEMSNMKGMMKKLADHQGVDLSQSIHH